ncbi:hypothetical protein MPDQ_000001 [Monascus purpureus]|uniref:Hypervirulence associated protein TUDOR domain-containing protein n=1 Tax=Monascus purpureus TaxID=5098 RepID=A0A507R6M9_MONPU|nr:hypothetical protein MPDQ_000001 [Monascus purpureus]
MPAERAKDKHGEYIQEGDFVFAKYRGGWHRGEAERIVVDEDGARDEGVVHPPKVVYVDQHGHRVAHNPSTLEKK